MASAMITYMIGLFEVTSYEKGRNKRKKLRKDNNHNNRKRISLLIKTLQMWVQMLVVATLLSNKPIPFQVKNFKRRKKRKKSSLTKLNSSKARQVPLLPATPNPKVKVAVRIRNIRLAVRTSRPRIIVTHDYKKWRHPNSKFLKIQWKGQ